MSEIFTAFAYVIGEVIGVILQDSHLPLIAIFEFDSLFFFWHVTKNTPFYLGSRRWQLLLIYSENLKSISFGNLDTYILIFNYLTIYFFQQPVCIKLATEMQLIAANIYLRFQLICYNRSRDINRYWFEFFLFSASESSQARKSKI